jgi:hypothetical protein
MLPSCSAYVVTDCESTDGNEGSQWSATIRAEIESKSEAEKWLSEYEKENSLDFRFRKSVKVDNSGRLVFKVIFILLYLNGQGR